MGKRPRHRRIPWKRVMTALIAILLLSAGALLWILNTEHSIQGDWSNVLPILFTVLGVTFALLTWLFPFSPDQSEAPQMPLARELVRGSLRMGDDSAANFPYITAPVQDAYGAATQTLLGISHSVRVDKQGILILGEANAGKTRLAFEALTHTLPRWPVLRWRPDSTLEKTPGEIRRTKRLVIFIDDLQDYVSSLRKDGESKTLIGDSRTTTLLSLVETVLQDVQKVVIVATCRLEDETQVRAELGQLFAKLTVIQLPRFHGDTNNPEVARIIADFQSQGSSHTQEWDGTLGSLVLGLSTKNSEYLKMQNDPATTVLRAMKLLARAKMLVHTEQYLRTICAEVFREKDLLTNEKTWQEAVNQLMLKQFVTEEVDERSHEVTLVIRKDSYFDRVITDYPSPHRPSQLNQDFARLQNIFVSLRNPIALVNLGNALDALKRDQEALDAYEQAIDLDPKYARAYNNKGNALRDLKRDQEALDAFEQAIDLDPKYALAYTNKGNALRNLKRDQEALAAYEQAIHVDPNDAYAYTWKGGALDELKRYQEALDAFEQSIHLDPNNALFYLIKGLALSELKRDQEALDAYEQAIHLNPNYADAYTWKGVALGKLKRYQEALDAYEQSIHLNPNYADTYLKKGVALDELKRYQEALDAYEQAIHLDPNCADTYTNKGVALRELKRYQEALDAYEQAIHLDPNDAVAYLNKGNVFYVLKHYEEAMQAYEQALRLDPNLAVAYYNKSLALDALGKSKEAQQAHKKAQQLGYKR